MAHSVPTGAVEATWTSEWDLSTKQYRIVLQGSADNKVICASAAGDQCLGVVCNKPESGQAARVRHAGIGKVVAGAAVTRGDLLRANATAFAVTGNSGFVLGWAMASATSGSNFTAFIQPHQSTA